MGRDTRDFGANNLPHIFLIPFFFSLKKPLIPKTIIFAGVIAFGGMLLSMNEGECCRFTKDERVTGEKG